MFVHFNQLIQGPRLAGFPISGLEQIFWLNAVPDILPAVSVFSDEIVGRSAVRVEFVSVKLKLLSE